ncbi:MAG: redoxin domain-containing protein [Saprospiraceae bacterium]|nr:redoxin domain-containing protein [Saprospiraceae bacterium]
MKSIIRITYLLLIVASLTMPGQAQKESELDENGNPPGFQTLELGAPAPDFDLPGIDGRNYTLAEFEKFDVLMVLFTSNHCPTSHSIEKRIQKLISDYSDQNFGVVAINPNHPDGLRIDELGFGEFDDSFEDMKPYAEMNGWEFPYIYDGETQEVARAYGCLATPHVFLFDRERRLRYAGRFDDSRYAPEHTVTSPDARNALEEMLAGKEVSAPRTKPHGCSTKWREKRAKNVVIMESWKKLPVFIEQIDVDGVRVLRANQTENYRLFNIWATWCVPCVDEFPELVSISRQFDMRGFDFVTISLDEAKHEAKALEFLRNYGAGPTERALKRIHEDNRRTNHYLYTGSNQDALGTVLDPEWPGPIPHTILVAPGGQIIWRHNGMIDGDIARSQVADALNRYWELPTK